jgi:hypothetical protein
MKLFNLVSLFVLVSSTSQASHFMSCDLEAKVVTIQNIARLDGVAIFRKGMEDYEQLVTIEVTKTEGTPRPHECLPVGNKSLLHVKKDQLNKFTLGQSLKLHYQNVGDSMGSRISWDLK